jgi:hypothetical protein
LNALVPKNCSQDISITLSVEYMTGLEFIDKLGAVRELRSLEKWLLNA